MGQRILHTSRCVASICCRCSTQLKVLGTGVFECASVDKKKFLIIYLKNKTIFNAVACSEIAYCIVFLMTHG